MHCIGAARTTLKVVVAAVMANGMILPRVPDEFQRMAAVVVAATTSKSAAYQFVREVVKQNPLNLERMVAANYGVYKHMSRKEKLLPGVLFVGPLSDKYRKRIHHAPEGWWKDDHVFVSCVRRHGVEVVPLIPHYEKPLSKRDVVESLVSSHNCGMILEFVDQSFRRERDIVETACSHSDYRL